MRILQIHKFFYPHAGSETAFFHTRDLLASRGHEIIDFAMSHPRNLQSQYSGFFPPQRAYTDPSRPKAKRALDATTSVYSIAARQKLRRLLDSVQPDVAHMHLVYHQLTMSIVDELWRAKIPMVMTLHDYKIGCPAYVLYRDGQTCRACTGGRAYNAVRYRCVKHSVPASALAAVEATLSQRLGKYAKIDGFVCPSEFAGNLAHETGIPESRIHVIPNFLPDSEVGSPVPILAATPRFLFAGRLEAVKGVEDLLSAFRGQGPEMGTLVLAGPEAISSLWFGKLRRRSPTSSTLAD